MTARRTPKKRGCNGKAAYPNAQLASDRISRIEDRGDVCPGELKAYRRPHCGFHHIGHAGKVGAR